MRAAASLEPGPGRAASAPACDITGPSGRVLCPPGSRAPEAHTKVPAGAARTGRGREPSGKDPAVHTNPGRLRAPAIWGQGSRAARPGAATGCRRGPSHPAAGLTTMMDRAGATKAQTAPLVMESQQLWTEAERYPHTAVPVPRGAGHLHRGQPLRQDVFPLRGQSEQPE